MPTVLIVDDSAFDRQLATSVLAQDDGLQVESVDGGGAALDRLRRGGVDLVVTDLQMPMIDGIQLVINMREDYPEIPVILMTGEGSELTAMEALTHGAVNYVPKKIMNEWLPRTVYEALSAQNVERTHQELLDAASFAEMHLKLNDSREMLKAILQRVEQTAAGILRCPRSDIVRLGIAVKEAIEHAMKINSEIEFEYQIDPECCRFVMRTTEEGKMIFDPEELPDQTEAGAFDSAEVRGFYLIRSHLDEVLIDDAGTEATLIMNVAKEDSAVSS